MVYLVKCGRWLYWRPLSRLKYCCGIWDPHLAKDRDNLEAVQRRAARFGTQDYSRDTSVTQLLKDLHWLQLKDRRRDIRLSLMYRIVAGKVVVPVDDILLPADSHTSSKHEHKYRHFISTCEQYKHSFLYKLSLSGTCYLRPVLKLIPQKLLSGLAAPNPLERTLSPRRRDTAAGGLSTINPGVRFKTLMSS